MLSSPLIGPPRARAAKTATSTIPIVFAVGADAVTDGLVASLSRPGGNASGVSILFTQLTGKRLELLSELAPQVTTIAALVNPNSPTAETTIRDAQDVGRAKAMPLIVLKAATESDIETAFTIVARCMPARSSSVPGRSSTVEARNC